ncbi:MAG: hypothetical protein Kow00120_04420 [Anaerolineae bacterium]
MSYRRPSNLRNARGPDGRWQWLFVGGVLGFGCALVGCLILVTTGYITLNAQQTATLATEIVANETDDATACGPVDEICGTAIAAAGGGATETPPSAPPTQPTADAADETEASAAGDTPPQPPAITDTPAVPDAPAETPTPSNTPPPTSTPPPTEQPIDPRLEAIKTELVPVTGGTFQMGTNQQEAAGAVQECVNNGGACEIGMAEDSFPPHPVTITSFQIERYEVSVNQFAAFLNVLGPGSHTNGCNGPCATTQDEDTTSPIVFDGDTYAPRQYAGDRPVTNVSWFGANAYCEAIGRRLPTEAEWERAARGPEGYIYPWGWTFDNTRANTNQSGTGGTTVIGTYPNGASPFGAEDMSGNAAEWVYDWYQPDFYSTEQARQLNPQGPVTGAERVIRGGAWDQRPFFSRTVHRLSRPANTAAPWIGFRCVSDENPPPGAAPAGGQADAAVTPSITPTLDPNTTPTDLPTLPPGAG